jgi:hypothetical protein
VVEAAVERAEGIADGFGLRLRTLRRRDAEQAKSGEPRWPAVS